MAEFLPKDPIKAIVILKDTLYNRLIELRENLERSKKKHTAYDAYQSGQLDTQENCWEDEIEFLQNLLDKIERS